MKNYGFNSIPISTAMVFAGIILQILGLMIMGMLRQISFGAGDLKIFGIISFITGTIIAGLYLKKSSSRVQFSFVASSMLILNIIILILFSVLSAIAVGLRTSL